MSETAISLLHPKPIDPAADTTQQQLLRFLEQTETRAYLMARHVTRDSDAAIELVQEAMTRLVSHYRHRPEAEWPALFHRILQNQLRDWQRQQSGLRARWRFTPYNEQEEENPTLPGATTMEPDSALNSNRFAAALAQALTSLTQQQQRTFMLRCWEGLSEKETAHALGLSIGSVKTHYFRALQRLRARLGDYHDE